jgi:acetylglutamate kinase
MGDIVIKIGGGEVDDPQFLRRLAEVVATMRPLPVVVHGGGKSIAQALDRMKIPFQWVEGLRVTDEASLEVVEMVLSGLVNKRLVRTLLGAGVRAIGLSGVDLGLMRTEKLLMEGHDLGYVGRIVEVDAEALEGFLAAGIVPVLSPISLGSDGHAYNVNADHAALAVAVALRAETLALITDVPGVMLEGEVVPEIRVSEVEAHIARGEIRGGMVPKARSAAQALEGGVERPRILDLDGVERWGRGEAGVGTAIVW